MAKKKFKIPMKGDNENKETPVPIAKCDACGKPLTSGWVALGTGDIIHMGDEYGLKCFNIMQKKITS